MAQAKEAPTSKAEATAKVVPDAPQTPQPAPTSNAPEVAKAAQAATEIIKEEQGSEAKPARNQLKKPQSVAHHSGIKIEDH